MTKIRAYVRAQYLREDANVDWTEVSAKVKHLIDSRIDAQVRQLMSPVSILDQQFEEKVKLLPHDEARASVMEHAIRAQIKERIAVWSENGSGCWCNSCCGGSASRAQEAPGTVRVG